MAAADLDVVIRRNAKEQHRVLMDAAKERRDHFLELAAKAKDKAARDRHKQAAKDTMLQGAAIARRLQVSAENAADSYARSIKKAAEQPLPKPPKPAKPPKPEAKKAVKKAAGKKKT
jgi:uncharacterized protein YutE (UPF0331/DUF86 family)